MKKKLDDGRGGPWGDRLSNIFQLLSLNKWLIGWAHRAPPSSQPGLLALALTCFMAASTPHSWSWHPVLLRGQREDRWGDLPHLACLKPRHQERSFALRQQKWKQTSSRSLDCTGEQTHTYILSPALLSALCKSKTLLDSTGSHLILGIWGKRSVTVLLSETGSLRGTSCFTFQEMTFAAGVHVRAH